MTRSRVPLSLHSDRCDRCGRCIEACKSGALKVGVNYIFVDWRICDGCLACVRACERGAIEERDETSTAPVRIDGSRDVGGSGSERSKREPPEPRRRRSSSGSAPSAPPKWSLLEAWALLVILLVLFVGKDALLTSPAVRDLSSDAAVFARVGVLFAFYLVQMLVLWGLAWRRGLDVATAFRLRPAAKNWPQRIGSAGLVLGMLVVVRVGAWVYGVTVQEFGWDPPVRDVTELTEVFGPTAWGLLLSVVLVVVVAPVVEEIVFRGVLQDAFAEEWGVRVGIVASAALFALYHLTLWLFLPLFALGVACGWLARTRRSLLPAIALHSAYNVLPVVIAFYLVW